MRAFNAEVPILAQWDDHEVSNDWWPSRILDEAGYTDRSALLLAARAGRAFHEYMPTRQTIVEPGRVYRKIGYGPLLDVFMIDMRSYRGPNWPDQRTAAVSRSQADCLAEARTRRLESGVEGHRRRPAAWPHQPRRSCAWRRPAGRTRSRDRRPVVSDEALSRDQHRLVDS